MLFCLLCSITASIEILYNSNLLLILTLILAQHSSAGDGFPYTNNDYSDKDTATTKVMTNPSEIERTLAAVFANIQYNYDIINDAYGVTVATSVEPIKKLLREAHRR